MEQSIEKYGFITACSSMRNEFSYIGENKIAQGRIGLQPLFWDKKGSASHVPKKGYELFPPAHLWNGDRLVQWDPMVFDRPTFMNPSAKEVIRTLKESIDFLKCDVCILSPDHGLGSTIISKYIPNDMPTITAIRESDDTDIEVDYIVRYDTNPFEVLAEKLNGKRVLSGFGCRDLFSESNTFQPLFPDVYDLDVYSPFLDVNMIDHIKDSTDPSQRRKLLVNICVD